jgi:HK97 family phage portal protein
MTRSNWMTAIVMNMLLYGKGNAVCVPHTYEGYLRSVEPISASRVSFLPVGDSYREYRVLIDGAPKDPDGLLHFVYNPDPVYLWKGRGVTVTLREIADNLRQARETEKAFMSSKWKPSVIVKVDSTADGFDSPEGRAKVAEHYLKTENAGEPWIIPAEQLEVTTVKPLSLADLAVNDTVVLDKKTVASVVGVPAFLLGVGEFKREEYNSFIQTTVRSIALTIQQELTRCLLVSPNLYFRFNTRSLLNYDLKTMSDILLAGADRGYINGDEWREGMYLPPVGLKERKVLENYIPVDMSGQQKKLIQDGDST